MDIIQLVTFSTVALLLVVSPGPNGVLIAKTVPLSGKASGFASVVGFISAFYLHGALSILGISVILTKSVEAFLMVKLLGALYLMWIGVKAIMDAFRQRQYVVTKPSAKTKKTLRTAYLEGFLTNTLNPKVSMFYLAAFPQFIPLGEYATRYAFLLVCIHAAVNAVWFGLMVVLLSRIKSITKYSLFQKSLKLLTGIIFITFGGKLLTLPVD